MTKGLNLITCKLCKKDRETIFPATSDNFVCHECLEGLRSRGLPHKVISYRKGLHRVSECTECGFQHIVGNIPDISQAFILSHPCPGEKIYPPIPDDRLGIRPKKKELSRQDRWNMIKAGLDASQAFRRAIIKGEKH